MFFFLFATSFSKNPIVLLPPFYGSNLWVTYNKTDLPWTCPKSENDTLLWVNPKYVLPHTINCMFRLLTTYLDDNDQITDYPNTTISIHDFGGDESARYAVNIGLLNMSTVVTYANCIDEFKSKGWTLKKDLFVAPFDWRIAPTYLGNFYVQLKELIEKAYELNDGHKVAIFGFSLGGFTTQQFLSKHVSQEWKDKYIEQAILLSPSFTGTTSNFYNLWRKRSPLMPIIKTEALSELFESWPIIHVHMPNEVIFENETLIYGPDGEEYKATQLYDLIMSHNKLRSQQFIKMYNKSEEIMREEPKELGVKTTILFNSQRKTPLRYNFSKGWEKNAQIINGEGDGTVLADGIRYVCKKWTNTRCMDFHNPAEEYNHQPLISNDHVLNIITNIADNYEYFSEVAKKTEDSINYEL